MLIFGIPLKSKSSATASSGSARSSANPSTSSSSADNSPITVTPQRVSTTAVRPAPVRQSSVVSQDTTSSPVNNPQQTQRTRIYSRTYCKCDPTIVNECQITTFDNGANTLCLDNANKWIAIN